MCKILCRHDQVMSVVKELEELVILKSDCEFDCMVDLPKRMYEFMKKGNLTHVFFHTEKASQKYLQSHPDLIGQGTIRFTDTKGNKITLIHFVYKG